MKIAPSNQDVVSKAVTDGAHRPASCGPDNDDAPEEKIERKNNENNHGEILFSSRFGPTLLVKDLPSQKSILQQGNCENDHEQNIGDGRGITKTPGHETLFVKEINER